MIGVRRAAERGRTNLGWLDSRHTFSFGDYRDPGRMGFRKLRVINDDRVAPGQGFGTHPHRDMEILSFVLEGALEHEDSMGNGSIIRPGEIQRMSAGTGVLHSERNPSEDEPVHFLQIWILPERDGIAPGYEQRAVPEAERRGRLRLIASRDGRDGSVSLHQDVHLHSALLAPGESVRHAVDRGRHLWLHVARGEVRAGGHNLVEGDGLSGSDEGALSVEGVKESEILLFDLA
jgi:redox-sensitive bicupin YhaK (pirin superfamily)